MTKSAELLDTEMAEAVKVFQSERADGTVAQAISAVAISYCEKVLPSFIKSITDDEEKLHQVLTALKEVTEHYAVKDLGSAPTTSSIAAHIYNLVETIRIEFRNITSTSTVNALAGNLLILTMETTVKSLPAKDDVAEIYAHIVTVYAEGMELIESKGDLDFEQRIRLPFRLISEYKNTVKLLSDNRLISAEEVMQKAIKELKTDLGFK